MGYWSEIQNDYFSTDVDPRHGDMLASISIDAWHVGEDQGQVVANVLLSKHGDVLVDYHDYVAMHDEMAQKAIGEAKDQLREYFRDLGHSERGNPDVQQHISVETPIGEIKEGGNMDLKEVLKGVDRDIRINVVNIDILNAVSFGKTFDEKREIFIQELTREVNRLRSTDYSRYDQKPFAWDGRYLRKPIDHWMIEQAVDAGLEHFAHEDGVKYQRVNLENGCYMFLDSDGDRVHEGRKVPKGATADDFVWSNMKYWAAAVPVNTKLPLFDQIKSASIRASQSSNNTPPKAPALER